MSSWRTATCCPEVGRTGMSSSECANVGAPSCTNASPTAKCGKQSFNPVSDSPMRSLGISLFPEVYFFRTPGLDDGANGLCSRASCELNHCSTYSALSGISSSSGGVMRYGKGNGNGVKWEKWVVESTIRERRWTLGFFRRTSRKVPAEGVLGSGVRLRVKICDVGGRGKADIGSCIVGILNLIAENRIHWVFGTVQKVYQLVVRRANGKRGRVNKSYCSASSRCKG